MRILGMTFSLVLLTTMIALAGTLPQTRVEGSYVEARTADVYTGPCFANSETNLAGKLAVFGWKVDRGTWEGVNLDGLGVVGVVSASATLGDNFADPYPMKAVLIVDERADAEQRLALQAFAKKMGGDLLSDIVRVDYLPIQLEIKNNDVHSATATLTAGDLATIQTRAMNEGDHFCANEEVWYLPLTKLDHAMPAYTITQSFHGKGLDTRWTQNGQRSGFVGNFLYQQ
jgi:hypothetical protein